MTGIIFVLLACRGGGGDQGTVVGNPGEATPQLAPPSGATYRAAQALVTFTDVLACMSEQSEEIRVRSELDLLESPPPLQIPGGTWCSIGVQMGVLYVSAETSDGGWLDALLFPGFIEMEAVRPLTIDGDSYILEFGDSDWLAPGLAPIESGEAEFVYAQPNDPLAEQLTERLTLSSALFEDDGDGVLDDEERDRGPLAVGSSRSAASDTGQDEGFPDADAGGCGSRAALLLLLPLWGRGRRRGRPSRA